MSRCVVTRAWNLCRREGAKHAKELAEVAAEREKEQHTAAKALREEAHAVERCCSAVRSTCVS